MLVIPVPVRDDNYAYIVKSSPKDAASAEAVFVDAYDVPRVRDAAHKHGLDDSQIVGLLTTHGHYDHAGGNDAFAKAFPGRTIWGGSRDIPAVNKLVQDGDQFTLFGNSPAALQVRAIATPCHTRDSICYHVEDPRSDAELSKIGDGLREGARGEKKSAVFTGYVSRGDALTPATRSSSRAAAASLRATRRRCSTRSMTR